nr:UBN2_2 domain-containing protein [Tanacetum cinerariifolium]
MSADSAVTFSFVHSETRSWSIPSEDPYEEAAQQLFEQAPHSPEFVPRDHVPVFITELEHPEDLVPAEGEATTSLLPPGFLTPRIRPLSHRAVGAEMNAIASSLYRLLHPSETPPLLPISTPSTSRRARIPEANQVKLTLGVMDFDHALRIDHPAAFTTESTAYQKRAYEQWERSNRMSLMIIKNSISVAIRGAIHDSENAKEYLSSVEEQFKGT